jgi:hypothetical protein
MRARAAPARWQAAPNQVRLIESEIREGGVGTAARSAESSVRPSVRKFANHREMDGAAPNTSETKRRASKHVMRAMVCVGSQADVSQPPEVAGGSGERAVSPAWCSIGDIAAAGVWVDSSRLNVCITRRPMTTEATPRRLSNTVRTAALRGCATDRIAEKGTIPFLRVDAFLSDRLKLTRVALRHRRPAVAHRASAA